MSGKPQINGPRIGQATSAPELATSGLVAIVGGPADLIAQPADVAAAAESAVPRHSTRVQVSSVPVPPMQACWNTPTSLDPKVAAGKPRSPAAPSRDPPLAHERLRALPGHVLLPRADTAPGLGWCHDSFNNLPMHPSNRQ